MIGWCWVLGVGMFDVGCWMLDVGCWMLDVGCWMLDVGCWMLDVGCSVSGIRCSVFNVYPHLQMDLVRQTVPHPLRPPLRPGLDAGRRPRPARLARLANLRLDPGRNGECPDLRDVVQSDRGPPFRQSQSAHRQPPSAGRGDFY